LIRLIIFDFDDTITYNKILDYQSFKIISKQQNSYILSQKEFIDLRKRGFLASDIIDHIQKKSKININKKEFWKERNNFLASSDSLQYLKIHPYVKNTFKQLKTSHIKIIVCSLRKNKLIIKNFLKKYRILKYVDSIEIIENNPYDTRKLNIAIKTKKKLYGKILKKYKIKPMEIVSVGDSISDQKAAENWEITHILLRFKSIYPINPKIKNQIDSFPKAYELIMNLNNLSS